MTMLTCIENDFVFKKIFQIVLEYNWNYIKETLAQGNIVSITIRYVSTNFVEKMNTHIFDKTVYIGSCVR